MAPAAFKFRKGPICLTDGEAQADSANPSIKLSKFDIFTTVLHFLSVYASTAGIGSLVWAYVVIQRYDRPWPVFHEEFVENFLAVIVLLSISIFWSIFNMWLLRKYRLIPPHTFTFVYNILMTFCLIYFPAVCCCRLYDKWSTIACAYLSNNEDKGCLPIYSTILESEVIGLASAFVVALSYLLHITARVIYFIISMKSDGRSTRFGVWLYDHGYSTTIAIYGVSWSLAMVGWFMMLWAYEFIVTFGSREGQQRAIWLAHSYAGFDILTILLLTAVLWFLANVVSMCGRKKPLSNSIAGIYDFGIATALISISIRCYAQLHLLEGSCAWAGQCTWIWKTIRPRQLAAIILALVVGLIHLSLCLNRLRCSLQWARDKNRINVLLNLLNFNEDFEGVGKMHAHPWTQGEIISIFRIKTSGDEVREYITYTLGRIRHEDVAAFNNRLSKIQIALNNLERIIRESIDRTVWDDDHLALLHNALYGELKKALNQERAARPIPQRYRHRMKKLSLKPDSS